MPTDATDYMSTRTYVLEKTRMEGPDRVYILSEDCATLAIIDHCRTMKDLDYLGTMWAKSFWSASRRASGSVVLILGVGLP
jgi:hypothetical protein